MAFAIGIERSPQQAVEQGNENAHHANAQHHARKIPGFGGLRDIGTKPRRRQLGIAPGGDFRDNAGVPRAARGGDSAGDVIGKMPGRITSRHQRQPVT